jgi:hypothetical protein
MSEAVSVDRDDLTVVTSAGDLSVEKTASRGPDTIAREIELTRAELADTIDAIADRISPKQAAARGAQAVKAQVASARGIASGNAPESRPGSHAASAPLPIVPIAAATGLIVMIALFLRRRRSR